jgi:hypothetical protein
MDPVTAFGLAGTLLQFLDTTSRFIGLAWRIYRNGRDNASDKMNNEVTTQQIVCEEYDVPGPPLEL